MFTECCESAWYMSGHEVGDCSRQTLRPIYSSWETPPQCYGVSLAIWDHTVLPATRHKWTHPA